MRRTLRLVCLLLAWIWAPVQAYANPVFLTLTCDLNGAPGTLRMGVEYQRAFDFSANSRGDISGVFPVGVTVYTYGDVTSAASRYSFHGQNQFADFVEAGSNQRFRVKWVMDARRNGLWMIINPFGHPARHFCALENVRKG